MKQRIYKHLLDLAFAAYQQYDPDVEVSPALRQQREDMVGDACHFLSMSWKRAAAEEIEDDDDLEPLESIRQVIEDEAEEDPEDEDDEEDGVGA